MQQTLSDYISKNFTIDQQVLGAILIKKGSAINTRGLKLNIAKKIASLDPNNLGCRVAAVAGNADILDFLKYCYDWSAIFNSLSSPRNMNFFQTFVWRSGLLQWLVNFTCRTNNNNSIQIKNESQLKEFLEVLVAVAAGHKFWLNDDVPVTIVSHLSKWPNCRSL